MKKIGFSGSLDPITNGHLWVIGEARRIADEVVVFISENPFKKCHFTAVERGRIVLDSCKEQGWNDVSVVLVKGDYTARTAKRLGVEYLIRGIRNNADFDYENLLQQANVEVVDGAKTLFVMPPRDLGSVSSTFVRGLQGPVGWHWLSKKFIPRAAYHAWIEDWLRREWYDLWSDERFSTEMQRSRQDAWLQNLLTAYSGAKRHYHNLDHLVHGLTELKVYGAHHELSRESMRTLQLAFWFHDYIYASGGSVCDEEASALAWLDSQLDEDNAIAIAQLIRASNHGANIERQAPLHQILIGADLAILGQPESVYATYAAGIRLEYQHVSDDAYCHARQRVLQAMLEKARLGTLFENPYFAGLYQDAAVRNLGWEIRQLEMPK